MLAGCTIPKSHHIRGASPSFGNKKYGTRETGDRRRSSMICNRFPSSGLRPSVSAEAPPRQDAVTGCHPFHGFQLPFFIPTRGSAPRAAAWSAPPPRYGYVARFTGFECRSLALANCPTNSNLSSSVLKLWDTCAKISTCHALHGFIQLGCAGREILCCPPGQGVGFI